MANTRIRDKIRAARKPPARIRYEQSHPTVSCRLSEDEYDLLKQRLEDLGGVSFADFVKDSLGILQLRMPETREIKGKAQSAGYEQGKKDHQIWYFCAVCGKRMNMSPNSNDHKAMIACMKEHGWVHGECR